MHQEMETLFFGTVRVTTRAIAVMRQDKTDDGVHRGGIVFNISSLAGIVGLPGHSFYHAGKFAVEGWSESVAREMHPDWNSGFPLSPFPPLPSFHYSNPSHSSSKSKFNKSTRVMKLLRLTCTSLSQLLHRRAQRRKNQLRRPLKSAHGAAPRVSRSLHASAQTRVLRQCWH
jgi:hypothetical protein